MTASLIRSSLITCLTIASIAAVSAATPTPTPSPVATAAPGCANLSVVNSKSPSGAWNAQTTEISCEFGYEFLSNAIYSVSLTSVAHSATTKQVFIANDSGPTYRPTLAWLSSTQLQITTYRQIAGTLQLTSFDGIAISYVYKSAS